MRTATLTLTLGLLFGAAAHAQSVGQPGGVAGKRRPRRRAWPRFEHAQPAEQRLLRRAAPAQLSIA